MHCSKKIQQILGITASRLYKEYDADNIVIVEGLNKTNFNDEVEYLKVNVLSKNKKSEDVFYIKNGDTSFENKIKTILIKAIRENYIKKEAFVVFVFDNSISNEFTLGMVVIEVPRLLFRIARLKLQGLLSYEKVLEKVISLAEEIRAEGREGKRIGTLFVIGDEEQLRPYLTQLILNPFYGYPKENRNIIGGDLDETIKEFAQLDGAFIISKEGIINSAGTYIKVDGPSKKYFGWGTRHLAAAGITEKTNSVAVLLSESGGKIKVFKDGKIVLKI